MDSSILPYLGLIDKNFNKEIKTAWFSGPTPKMLIVTKSDKVYGFGKLPDSSRYSYIFQPRPIHQLDGKRVKKIVFGGDFLVALTGKGEVFSWGVNRSGQLGITGNTSTINIPSISSISQTQKEIIDVACGSAHVIVLFNDKRVCGWGAKLQNYSEYTASLTEDAIGITCSETGAFWLTSNGEVFGIGYLFANQSFTDLPFLYSIGDNYCNSPLTSSGKINSLSNIVKITAGKNHAIALDNEGIVFVWGSNERGQLTNAIGKYQETPINIEITPAKIIDIAANWQSDLSAVMTENSEIYVWGLFQGGVFSKPTLTSFTSFNEVFANLSDPKLSFDSIKVDPTEPVKSVNNGALESIFDVQDYSDFTINIEEKNIYVHKIILIARSKYFHAMFTKQWKESDKKGMKISGYSYDSFRSFLSYLYSGEIEVTTENVFELVNIADRYSDEALLGLIEKKIEKCSMSGEVIKLLKEMMKLSSTDYEKFCAGMKKMMISPISEPL